MESKFTKQVDLELLSDIEDKSVDLVLTDPPYIISRKSGMQSHSERKPGDKGYEQKSTSIRDGEVVEVNYKRTFAYSTDYGDWDKNYTIEDLEKSIKEFYRILRPGGSCIIFFDMWKIQTLFKLLNKFSKHRLIVWVKTNPVPVNQKATYLSNSKEIAVSCVKGGKATFNSEYDNGMYEFPIYSGRDRFHPTQKSLPLIKELIEKHSNKGDIIVDPYGGSATTYVAARELDRVCISGEPSTEYYEKSLVRIKSNLYIS
jgi:site-specific DNA-methyltransferase (adenine-specific)